MSRITVSPEGATYGSVPDVPLIEADPMTDQYIEIFLLKCHGLVMLPLFGDVLLNGGTLGFRYGEGTLARLPCKSREFRPLGLDPPRRRLFNFFHRPADALSPPKLEKDVDVVLDGIDDDRRTAEILEDSSHVGVKRGPQSF